MYDYKRFNLTNNSVLNIVKFYNLIMSNKNFYITTPIYYPSGKPHMGHAYSSIIADIFARFKRNDNFNVFLTGTDEHGLKMQEAEKNSKDIKLFCDELSSKFKELTNILHLSNDDFIEQLKKDILSLLQIFGQN